LVAEIVGQDTVLSVTAGRALCESPATVGEPTRRRAFVLSTGVDRLAARAADADLSIGATNATAAVAVDACRADTFVLDALVPVSETVAAANSCLLTATLGRNDAAFRSASIASAAVLLATAGEVFTIRSANGPCRTTATFDGAIATIWKSAAFDGNAEGCEIGDHFVAGLGNTFWFLGVVTAAIAAPAEIARRTVRRLTTAE